MDKQKEINITSKDFQVGQIYKMKPAKDSHVKFPYYVEIIEVGINYIVTNIPGEHSLKIIEGTYEWEYHIPRMEYIGTGKAFREMTINQNLI